MKKLIAFVILSLGVLFAFGLLSVNQTQQPSIPSIDTPSILSIPSLDIKVPVIYPASNSEDDIQKELESGVVHYFRTALPGQVGNVYIVGHSSDYPWNKGEYKTIFASLPDTKIGAQIKITFEGEEYIYEVIETKIVEADDLSVLEQPNERKLLTLQTSYPIGTALQRFLVITELIQ